MTTDTLSTRDSQRLRSLIYKECGIHLGAEKELMLEARLRKLMRRVNLESLAEYCAYVFAGEGGPQELVRLIDAVTTNKTDFFRENRHFEFLTEGALPTLERDYGAGSRSVLKVWSAGCSTGEEPYTLAMVLSEYAAARQGYQFRLLATDISTAVLDQARRAVYKTEVVKPIATELRHKYMLRSKDHESPLYRIAPELRNLVEFRRLNLMDSDFGMTEPSDVIFCRNVIIYFDRQTRDGVLDRLTRQLRPGGFLFLGHSETLNGLDVPLTPVGPTVYRKQDHAAHHR